MNQGTFWMVWNPNGSAPTVCHKSEALAQGEANRLARQHPGQNFYVLQAITETVKNDVVTRRLDVSDDWAV